MTGQTWLVILLFAQAGQGITEIPLFFFLKFQFYGRIEQSDSPGWVNQVFPSNFELHVL